jgi:hypothetical protein
VTIVTTRTEVHHGLVASWQPSDDIPDYLQSGAPSGDLGPAGPGFPSRHELWLGAQKIASTWAGSESEAGEAPAPPSAAKLSARFLRMVTLPGIRLAPMLEEWWSGGVKKGSVAVGRRLRLESPRGDPARGWIMAGRIRTRGHWVPVVVELWPVYDKWTMMTMTPRVRVFASQHYFRIGQSALDRLTAGLAQTRAATGSPNTVTTRGGR